MNMIFFISYKAWRNSITTLTDESYFFMRWLVDVWYDLVLPTNLFIVTCSLEIQLPAVIGFEDFYIMEIPFSDSFIK